MRTLHLHIGLPKTGSSALQSWLSLNSQALALQGIEYADLVPEAKHGMTSSGNGFTLYQALAQKDLARARELLTATYFGNSGRATAIVSSEFLGWVPKPLLLQARETCNRHDIQVHIIAFVRSVYERAYSGYIQDVKTKGRANAFCIEDVATRFTRTQKNLLKYLRVFRGAVTVLNYDDPQRDIFAAFADAAGVDPAPLQALGKQVNRSLSGVETEIMRRLNALHDGRFARPLSTHLIEHSPGRGGDIAYDEGLLAQARRETEAGREWLNTTFGVSPPIAADLYADRGGAGGAAQEPREIYGLVATWLLEFEPAAQDRGPFGDFIGAVSGFLEDAGTDPGTLQGLRERARRLAAPAG